MKILIRVVLFSFAVSCSGEAAPPVSLSQIEAWPDWSYGFLTAVAQTGVHAPACPLSISPRACSLHGEPRPDDGIKLTLADSDQRFTRKEANNEWGPADWYPDEHPPTPAIIAVGREVDGVRPCSLCHYANGQGKPENAHIAGLPKDYIVQQLNAFATGERHNADPRKSNTNEMARMARWLSKDEMDEIAEYYSSMSFRPWIKVVESEFAPQVHETLGGLMIPIAGVDAVPLGNRIIEVPQSVERTEAMRDPRSGFVAYVPEGSIAKGEALVTTGGGKTIQCKICHGDGLRGLGEVPAIAGRSASYAMRQLWDIQQGSRTSPLMTGVVSDLSYDDMLNIVAYVASLSP